MKQYKIRVIAYNGPKSTQNEKYGITIPAHIGKFYPPNTFFRMELFQNGSVQGVMLISGEQVNYTQEDIKNYNFEDIRV